jgi:sulfate adenylyltransferase subunit 2
MRAVVAETETPVMLYSIGKDSSVMLEFARRAFHPTKPPFPLPQVDILWTFKDMYAFSEPDGHGVGHEADRARQSRGPADEHRPA